MKWMNDSPKELIIISNIGKLEVIINEVLYLDISENDPNKN